MDWAQLVDGVNLYLRLLRLWLRARRSSGERGLGASRLPLRVWPSDLDLFAHMNNGRYLTVMDLGRLDIVLRSGLSRVMRERGWHAVASAVDIRYLRPLKLWQRYVLVTEIVDWDEAWFLFEQRFEAHGKLGARSFVKAQFRRKRERVPTAVTLAAVGMGAAGAPAGGRLISRLASPLHGERT